MGRVFIAPGKYVQGSGVIHEIGRYASVLGSKALVIGGKRALAAAQEAVESSLGKAGMGVVVEGFRGECSKTEIKRVTGIAKKNSVDLIIAVGGGKAIDTGKAVACGLKLPVVVVPTIVATDAPCSALSAIYTDDGVFEGAEVTPHNPNCVLVDTDERKVVTPALEKIVEANILLSGLGFESGGLAGAHSVCMALDVLPAPRKRYHGEKVAFGTLVQLVMEGRSREEINEVMSFCKSVGLPTNLAALGVIAPSEGDIMRVAESATKEGRPIHDTWFPVTAKMVYGAIWAADAIGS